MVSIRRNNENLLKRETLQGILLCPTLPHLTIGVDGRTREGRRPPKSGPRSPHLLRLDDRPPLVRVRSRSRAPCPHSFSRGPPKVRPIRRTASVSQARRWQLGVVYNTAAAICQGANADTDAKILRAKLSLDWTGPYKVLAIGPCSSPDTPEGSPLATKLVYLDLSSDDPARMHAGAFQYNAASPVPTPTTKTACRFICGRVCPNVCSTTCSRNPPRTASLDVVSTALQRLDVEKITGHQSVRGQGGVIAVMYEMHWTGFSRASWLRETLNQLTAPPNKN